MQKMQGMFKKEKSNKSPRHQKQVKAGEQKRKGQRKDRVKHTTTRTGKNYETGLTEETRETRLHGQRPRGRERQTQFTQTDYTDFEDQFDGKRYGRRYYNDNIDRGTYNMAPTMSEYTEDERRDRSRSRATSQYYQSESECSDSECSDFEYRKHMRSEAEPSDYTYYDYRERRRPIQDRGRDSREAGRRNDDMPYTKNNDYNVYAARQPIGHRAFRADQAQERRLPDTDYDYDTEVYDEESDDDDTGYTTEYGRSYDDQTEDSTVYGRQYDEEYGRGYGSRRYKDQVDGARGSGRKYKKQIKGARDNGRPYQDEYERHGRQYQVYAAHTKDKTGTVFEQQRMSPLERDEDLAVSKSPKPLHNAESEVVYLPVIVNDDGVGLPADTVMSPKELMSRVEEQAENPFETNVQIYAATNLEQGNVFQNAVKEHDRGPLPLAQNINVFTSQEESNPNQQETPPRSLLSEHSIDQNHPNGVIRKSYINVCPSILKTRTATSVWGRTGTHKDAENEFRKCTRQNTNVSTGETNAYETNNRKSEAGRSSTRQTKQNMAEEPQNKTRKSMQTRENPTESHTLIRQTSGTEENIYSSNAYETNNRKSEAGRSSTRQTKQNMAEEPQNKTRKSMQTRANPTESHTLIRQTSGTEENIYSSNAYETNNRKSEAGRSSTRQTKQNMAEEPQNKTRKSMQTRANSTENPTKSHTLIRQIGGTEENIYSSNDTRQSAARAKISMGKSKSTSNMRTSHVEEQQGPILKKSPSTESVRKSGKGGESMGNVARKKTMVTSLFRRKKTTTKSHDELEDFNRPGNLKQHTSFTESYSKTNLSSNKTNPCMEDRNNPSLLVWGYDVSFLINLFPVLRTFFGLNMHDTMMEMF